jgi:ribonuclease D
MPKSIQVINLPDALEALCRQLNLQPFVAVDTEFMRQTTYRPKLCLIQVAAPGVEALIDPLSPGMDLAPFYELMANRSVIKVFHAARQDVEIVYQEAGVIPEPLFDTQIAAMALGFGEAISYNGLVSRLLRKEHDKSYQAVDWTARPMAPRQMEYALGDVTYLRDIYIKLKKKLAETGRESWLEEEVALLTDPKTYTFDPADAWKRLRINGKSQAARNAIKALAAWREEAAQRENVPRGRVIKDETIYEIAKFMPVSVEALGRLRSSRDVPRARWGEIVAAVKSAREAVGADADGDDKSEDAPGQIPAAATATIELLRVLLKAVAADLNIASKLIASAEDLEKLAVSDTAGVRTLEGWRREAFGAKALALKQGQLALTVRGGKVVLIETGALKGG